MPEQDYEHPLKIEIVVPSDEPRQGGVYSTKHPEASIIYCRFNRFDTLLIDKLALELGMKPGTFVKLAALKVAHRLEELQNAHIELTKPRR
jgi:hypothetical protein